MKLLIITQKIDVNDDVLGFMHGWIAEFAEKFDEVVAIGLYVGEHHLPPNVRVLSLGKEKGVSRLGYLLNFYRHIIRERKNYDAVFVHMNQIYVLLGGLLWRAMGKRIGLWYAHGHTSLSLRFAEKLSHIVFSSTKSGFRLRSRKLHIIGQGIDTDQFTFVSRSQVADDPFRILIVGRISPVKDYETLLRAVRRLCDAKKDVVLDIVGAAGIPEQELYLRSLKDLAYELQITDRVNFVGKISHNELSQYLAPAHCFANTSRTGSFDKAIGEAMASGLPVLTSNIALKEVLGQLSDELVFPAGDDEALADRLLLLMDKSDDERNLLGRQLRELIVKHHSLSRFVQKILSAYRAHSSF